MEVQVKLVPSGVDEDGEDQFLELDAAIIDTLKPILTHAVHHKVNEVTDKVIKAIVEEHVGKLSIEAFNGVFQATDTWGQKKGVPKSLAEVVSDRVRSYLDQRVNIRGEISHSGTSRCQYLATKAINDAIAGELVERLATLRAEFADKIAKKLANVKVT